MNWEQFAKKKGFAKAKIKMVRVPVYARKGVSSFKQTTQVVYIEDPKAQKSNCYWKNVIGSITKDRRGDYSAIDTDKARYEIDSVDLIEERAKVKTFIEYVDEQARIDEIGNSAKPYKYKVQYKRSNIEGFANGDLTQVMDIVRFKTDLGHHYFIDHISMRKAMHGNLLEVGFGVFPDKSKDPEASAFDLTDGGLQEAFKVMSTVISSTTEVLKEFHKKYDLQFQWLMFSSSQVGKGNGMKAAAQREKLYRAFIKKQPHLGKITSSGKTMVEIKPGFYK